MNCYVCFTTIIVALSEPMLLNFAIDQCTHEASAQHLQNKNGWNITSEMGDSPCMCTFQFWAYTRSGVDDILCKYEDMLKMFSPKFICSQY